MWLFTIELKKTPQKTMKLKYETTAVSISIWNSTIEETVLQKV